MTTGELPGKKKTAGLRRGANAGSGRAGRLLPARRSPPGRLPRRRSGPLGRRASLGRKPAALEKETLTGCLAGLMAPTRETQLLVLRFARRSWQDFTRESRQAVGKKGKLAVRLGCLTGVRSGAVRVPERKNHAVPGPCPEGRGRRPAFPADPGNFRHPGGKYPYFGLLNPARLCYNTGIHT